tara:strand:- start:219 stop:1013 length:795 start_codon:yes stop_codon:yes gene_type:complete
MSNSDLEFKESPYKEIPPQLRNAYTMNGQIPVLDFFFDGSHPNGVKWDNELINKYKKVFTPENLRTIHDDAFYDGFQFYGHWSASCLLDAFEKYDTRNKKVAIVGSETPWLEAILLNLNNKVTTIEYNVPESNFDNLECKDYFNFFEKNEGEYDTIVTYSSVEHSGLGRYGDPLDPDGDLKTMKTIHQNLKKDGILIWGAPVGKDCLAWNAHRIYGEIRLPILFRGFKELEWINQNKKDLLDLPLQNNSINPVVVLKKENVKLN